jgi:TP901 family phage tail tape measure protein
VADVRAKFVYDADFSSSISQIKLLARELSVLNNSFNSLDKDARKTRSQLADLFKGDVGDLGAFTARTVDITSNIDNFGTALDRNKLKLRDYAREARKAFQANSNTRKLAEDQVRRTKSDLVELGMDADGRRKGILVTPLRLDMSDMQNQIEVARRQFSIFNKLINDGSTSLINWGKNTQWAGRQLTVGLTVPMTMFATATIKAFNDVDRELTRFQKVYGSDLVGATKEASEAIRKEVQALAIDIAGSYGIASKETAALAADLAATGLEGQKLMDSIKQTTRLSVLGEIDRQDAMKTTLSLQNAFKMSTQELGESINFLNAVENQTSLSLQDLTVAIPKVGPVVKALGGDIKDLSVLMVAMKEGGINAAEGANALKSGLASLINPSKQSSAMAKEYGINLEEIANKNKGQLLPTILEFQSAIQTIDDFGRAKIIEQLFGKFQFARIAALFDNLNSSGSQTVEVLKLMGVSSKELAEIADGEIKTLTESASMRFQRAMEAIKASLLPVGEVIVNSVLPFMERLSGVFDKIISFAKDIPGPIKSFIKAITGITAVAGPIIMMAGVLGNFAGYIIKGAMAFVTLGRRIRGLPTEKFQLLDDTQIAASKATDTLTISIGKQRDAMVGLNRIMMDYQTLLMKQRSLTPGLFNDPMATAPPTTQSSRRPRRGGVPPIRRQKGGAAWVPGSGSGDKIPALLEPGEFVINRNAAKQYGGVLEDINNGVPRFQSGGKIPGYMSGFTGPRMAAHNAKLEAQKAAREAATRPKPNAPRPIPKRMQDLLDSIMKKGGTNTRDDSKDPKMFDPAELTGVLYGENRAINDVFVRGDKETRKIILDKIVGSENLTESDKMRILGSLDSETNLVSLEDRRKLADELDILWRQGTFDNVSVGQQLKIATLIEAPRYGIKDAQTFSQVDPTLKEPKLGRGPNNRSNPFSPSVTRQSLFRGFGETDEDSLLRIQEVYDAVRSRVTARPTSREIREQKGKKKQPKRTVDFNTPEEQEEEFLRLLDQIIYGRKATFGDGIYGDAAHMYMYQSGGPIKAMRGIKMPEAYATKLATIKQSMATTNKEAMSSNVPLVEIGTRQSRIGGHSSAIPGVNGVYEINGKRYVVKGHDTYDSAKAEADMTRITRDVFGLQSPNQEAIRIRHPETGDLMFAVRSQYDDMFATSTGRFSEGSVFNQIIAAAVRRDKDLQAGNIWDNIVADVGQAGIMNKASQPRIKTGPTNSVLEQLAVNLGMVKAGARSHGAEAWNVTTAKMTDDQIARGIKSAAQEARSKLNVADISEDFAYIRRDLDDIISSDLAPFISHLRTVVPKVKKPPTQAALAKKEQQKILDREERQAALDAGYPQWAMQSGGVIKAQNGGVINARRGIKTPKPSQHQQSALQEYWQNPKSAHTESKGSVFRNLIEGYVSQGIIPRGSQLFRALSPEDSKIMQSNAGNLFAPSVRSTTTDKKAAFEVASGARDLGSGSQSVSSVARIIANRKTSGIDMGEALPFTKPKDGDNFSMKEVLLSPTDLYTVGKISRKIVSDGQSSRVMEYLMTTSKPTTIERIILGTLFKLTKLNPKRMNLKNIATPESQYVGGRSPEGRAIAEAKQQEAFASGRFGVQTGGMIRAQNGAWVPGRGEGDRVPALLEPGEFVVNKKAAKQYGGMLEDMNWNLAPRFNEGTPRRGGVPPSNSKHKFTNPSSIQMSGQMSGRMPGQMPGMAAGAVSGGLMAASMAGSMMLPVNKFTDALNKSIMALAAFTGILSAMQLLGVNMGGGFGKKMSGATVPKAGSKAEGILKRGEGKVATGKSNMAMSGVGNKLKGARALSAGKALMGVGRTVALASNPVGWGIAAVMAVTSAVMAYKKALDSAKKSAQQVFGVSKAEAEAFGVEIRSVPDAIKANQEYTKTIGAQAQQSQFSTPGRLDPEKEAAVLGANEDLTKRLRNLGETKLGVGRGNFSRDRSMERTDVLAGKYASLLQQGFSEEDANIMVRTLAKASGAMDSYYQAQQRFKSIKADDSASIVKAQMEALETFNTKGFGGGEGAFSAGIKEIVSNLNLLPPEDQYRGLKELLTQIETLDTSKLKVAQQSLVDMAKENYGEGSQIFNTQRAIQERTDGSFSWKNVSTWNDWASKGKGKIDAEQATRVATSLNAAFETGVITDQQLKTYELKIEADPNSIDEIEQEVDVLMRARELKIKIDIEYKEKLDNELEENNKKIILEQQRMQDAMDAKSASMEKEQEAFKESQKAGQKYIKGKQNEIAAINKGTDKYIKSLEKRASAENFYQNQQKTALGGLSALASGDIFGFLDSQRQMAQDSAQFGFDQEIEQIDETRNVAVEGLQEEIDKKQEALELQAEAHEARMIQLEKEREQMAKNFAKSIADMQALSDGLAAIRGNDKILEWLNTINDPFAKAAQQAAIINYLITNPAATLDEAFKSVQNAYNQNNPRTRTTSSGGEHPSGYSPTQTSASPSSGGESKDYASGGFVSGPGTPTSDSIPARLSDGEYVIKASSVEKFGKATFDSLNNGEPVAMYANGGLVNPTRSGRRGGNPYGIKKTYYSLGYHTGQDYEAGVGDDVLAVADGSVVGAGFSGSLGNLLTIQHADGIRTYYAHLSKMLKKTGDVKKGDHVAEAGFSGNVIPKGPDGAHLHFEVRKSPYGFNKESIVNPNSYLSGSYSVGGKDIDFTEESTRTRQQAIAMLASSGEASPSDLTNLMEKGAASVYQSYPGRRFGGSMTMNKPYLVGENGPEVVLPYGAGSRVEPNFSIPSASSGIIDGAGAGSLSQNISIIVNGAKSPQEVAKYVVEQINKQDSRRDFGRSV